VNLDEKLIRDYYTGSVYKDVNYAFKTRRVRELTLFVNTESGVLTVYGVVRSQDLAARWRRQSGTSAERG
jgi:hypothetical protein